VHAPSAVFPVAGLLIGVGMGALGGAAEDTAIQPLSRTTPINQSNDRFFILSSVALHYFPCLAILTMRIFLILPSILPSTNWRRADSSRPTRSQWRDVGGATTG